MGGREVKVKREKLKVGNGSGMLEIGGGFCKGFAAEIDFCGADNGRQHSLYLTGIPIYGVKFGLREIFCFLHYSQPVLCLTAFFERYIYFIEKVTFAGGRQGFCDICADTRARTLCLTAHVVLLHLEGHVLPRVHHPYCKILGLLQYQTVAFFKILHHSQLLTFNF